MRNLFFICQPRSSGWVNIIQTIIKLIYRIHYVFVCSVQTFRIMNRDFGGIEYSCLEFIV